MNEQNANGTVTPTPNEAAKRRKRNVIIIVSVLVGSFFLLFAAPILIGYLIHLHFYPPGHTYVYKGGESASAASSSQYTKLVIKKGVETIPDEIFAFAKFEDGVSIPDSVVRIGKRAFYYDVVTEFSIPDSVTEIGEGAFSTCRELQSVKLSSNLTEIAPSTFYSCYSLTEITIPNGVTKIGNEAFSHCKELPAVAIPASVREIGSYAFYCCSALNELALSEGLSAIGSYAFSGCTSLQSVAIPDGVESIGDYAFRNTRLTSVTLPASVGVLGYRAFGDCPALTEITFRGTKDQWNAIEKNENCFSGSSVATVRCSDGDISIP